MQPQKRFLFVLSLIVGLACTLFGELQAQGVNKMTFTTLRNNSAKKDWVTDSVTGAKFGTSVVQLIGYFPTGRTDIPYQRMQIRITGFTGKGSYTKNQVSTSFFEDLFQSQIVQTQFTTGSLEVTDFVESPFSISATYHLKLVSQPPSASSFPTEILNGVVKVNVKNSLVVSGEEVISDTSKPVKAVQGNKLTWKLYAKDKDGVESEGASIYETNKILGTTDKLIGVTDKNGMLVYSFTVPKDKEPDMYQVRFVAKKDKYEDSDPFLVKVKISTARYYYYKCAGMPIYVFDAGEGHVWEGKEGETTIKSTGTTTINSFLYFDGSAIIDTTEGAESFSGTGRLYAHDITLPGGAGPGDYTLLQATVPPLKLSCTALFDKGLENIGGWLSKIMDCDIKITKMRFTNTDEVADGLEMAGSLAGGEKQLGQCNEKEAQYGVSIEGGFKITTAGLKDLSFQLKDVGMGPGACLKKLGFTYTDNPVETFKLVGAYESKVFGGIDGELTWMNKTKTTPITFGIKLDKKLAECKLIPDTPFCLETIGGDASCSDKLELRRIGVHGVIVSDEKILESKFNFKIPVIEQLAEMDIHGFYEAPFKLGVGGAVKLLKIPSIGGKDKEWQIEGSNDVELDVSTNTVTVKGLTKVAHLGGTKHFFETNQTTILDWTSGFDFSAQSSGVMTLPDLSEDLLKKSWVAKIVKWLKDDGIDLPAQLGSADYRLHNASLRANIDLSTNPVAAVAAMGKGYLEINFDASTPWGFFDFGEGTVSLKGTKERDDKGNDIQGAASNNDRAKATQKFDVDNSMERVLVYVTSNSQVPASTIVDPSGARFTVTAKDANVTQFVSKDKSLLMWVLVNPKVGQWTLELTNPAATDSVEVHSVAKARTFAVNATTNNRTLTVTWDGSKEESGSTVEIYLDEKAGSKAGRFIGSAAANSGTFTKVLSDTLPACEYFVYATRLTSTEYVTSHASGSISTGKSILAAPQNIVANSNQKGNTKVSWNRGADPRTAGYYIIVRDGQTNKDSVYATMYSDELEVSLLILDPINKMIFVQSYDTSGFRGCPSQARPITVDVEDERGASRIGDSRILLIPNPTSATTTIRFETSETAPTQVYILNALGQVVSELPAGLLNAGSHTLKFDSSTLSNGAYIVRVVSGNQQYSTVLSVVH